MATKITKKDLTQDEFLDTVFDLGEWVEKHWRTVLGAGIGLMAVGALIVGWSSWRESTSRDANRALAEGLAAFEPQADASGKTPAPDYATALARFDDAASKAGGQAVGSVARLYRGRALIALGRASEAVPVLEGVSQTGNPTLAALGKATLADALAASGNLDRAAALLTEMSAATGGAYPPDAALFALAGVRERQGKKAEARRAYQDLVSRFPQSPFAESAKKETGGATAR